jgi:hypothetical protein
MVLGQHFLQKSRRRRHPVCWTARQGRDRAATASRKVMVSVGKIALELLIERLADWGVDTIFGLPGDGISGIMEGSTRSAACCRPTFPAPVSAWS